MISNKVQNVIFLIKLFGNRHEFTVKCDGSTLNFCQFGIDEILNMKMN
jgi:hypothetical protein